MSFCLELPSWTVSSVSSSSFSSFDLTFLFHPCLSLSQCVCVCVCVCVLCLIESVSICSRPWSAAEDRPLPASSPALVGARECVQRLSPSRPTARREAESQGRLPYSLSLSHSTLPLPLPPQSTFPPPFPHLPLSLSPPSF
ncbi:uncharacterized protein AKAW2_31039S [Aspergillus luchuensis]|uniref:Uncharacterized protein n=1 Tax=Aspergillus kawachii TaxID=1069201 RepID=A0A7R7W7H8_ASPKA|nr:uncharacterized protein AKAW2_31039S [Aspergillus luchuensis]BCR97720.1 hypothetical protein AKAW2_31039S [Aspergillus luchuensis]